MSLILYGYWRSGTTYRTRIALNLTGLTYETRPVNLPAGEQGLAPYRALAPQGLVPALAVDGEVLIQSPAILEWLEETHPEPPLLPKDAAGRARVRAMAALIGCDIHPLNNLRVLRALRRDLGASDVQLQAWETRWITEGFAALEDLTGRTGGAFCHGDAPTLADCYLVPQVYSALRFGVDLAAFPRLREIDARARALAPFAAAHPDRQPGAAPV